MHCSIEVDGSYLSSNQEPEVIEMDGFVIELEVDADEQLMVSREEPYKPPDYRCVPKKTFAFVFIFSFFSGGARCIICMSVFSEITEAVSHIHKTHDIQVRGCFESLPVFVCLYFTKKSHLCFFFHQKSSLICKGRSSSPYVGRREASEGRIPRTLPRRHQDLSHGEGIKAEKAEVAQDV